VRHDTLPTSVHSDSALAFGSQAVLAPFALDLAPGRWIAVLGQSGIGKSTMLRALAGLLPQARVTPDLRGRIAWMAQTDLLLPWLPLVDNLCLGARLRGETADSERARALLGQVGLSGRENSLPATLSGGMRQRAALARTLMEDRPLVLMDEPFAALDLVNKRKLHQLSAELLSQRCVIFVTHDPAEALSLADHVYILAGTPATLTLAAEPSGARPRDVLAPEHVAALRAIQATLLAEAA